MRYKNFVVRLLFGFLILLSLLVIPSVQAEETLNEPTEQFSELVQSQTQEPFSNNEATTQTVVFTSSDEGNEVNTNNTLEEFNVRDENKSQDVSTEDSNEKDQLAYSPHTVYVTRQYTTTPPETIYYSNGDYAGTLARQYISYYQGVFFAGYFGVIYKILYI